MKNTIDKILSRGVSELIGGDDLRKKLENDPTKVVIKYGVDPTKPDLHLGHAVCLRKLREFQDLGCRVIFLIGDFTAMIGDPTGKNKLRPVINLKEVHENMKTYINQANKVLDFRKIIVLQNSTWYMTFDDFWATRNLPIPFITGEQFEKEKKSALYRESLKNFDSHIKLMETYVRDRTNWENNINKVKAFISLKNLLSNLSKVTFDQLIKRDMFEERQKNAEPIFMHEMVYPIIQAVDSLVIAKRMDGCDLEVGGTDQYFNMLMGRQIMEKDRPAIGPQAVLTLPILEGTDGKEKMSKSLGNHIGITESPTDIFGKTMRIPDSEIPRWVELCTDLDFAEFEKRSKKENPKNLKIELAREIVKIYHSADAADAAEVEFARLFSGDSKSGRPDEIPEIQIEEGSWGIVELLNSAKLVASKSEARRLIEGGGVRVNDSKVEKVDQNFEIGSAELILQIGKRRWARIVRGD